MSEKTLGRVLSLNGLDKEWDKLFPDVEDRQVFDFWDTLVESLGCERKRRPVSKPSATIKEVYERLHPEESSMDAKELQNFTLAMKEKFGVDLVSNEEPWELLLGDLFEMTQTVGKA